jgi:hypothetical protein
MARFDGSRHRIDRALMHAKTFTKKANALVKSNPPSFAFDFKHDGNMGGIGTVRAIFAKPFDKTLPLELGEFFYQLRAALDGAFWEAAVILLGGKIPSKPDSFLFPICPTPEKFGISPLHKLPFPKELYEFVCSIQPYRMAEYAGHPEEGFIRTVKLLHDCARFDRHRQLSVMAAFPSAGKATLFSRNPYEFTHIQILRSNFLENECHFLGFRIDGWDGTAEPDVALQGHLDIEVSVKEIPRGLNLGDYLEVLRVTTEYIVEEFAKAFP